MSDRSDDAGIHRQTSLGFTGYRSPSGPPPTRGDCGEIARPCPRTTCPHNLQREDEPAGRPSDGSNQRRMPIRRVEREESCDLDVAQAHLDGLSRREVGRLLDITPRRVGQLEQRAAVKQRLVHDLFRLLDAYRERLPAGVELTVEPVRGDATAGASHSVAVVITLDETKVAAAARSLGVIRRRPGEDKGGTIV